MPVSSRRITPLTSAWKKLREHGWLADRSDETSELLLGIAKLRNYGAGEEIYVIGDPADGVYGLVEGALDATIPRLDGCDLRIHRADPGYWVGDAALFAEQTRLISMRAARPSTLVFLPGAALRKLVAAQPALARDFHELSYESSTKMLQIIANLAISPSEVRIGLRLLMQLENLGKDEWIRISHEHLAELTALSIASLERGLKRLEAEGLVATGYGRIRVLHRKKLLRFCGDASIDSNTVFGTFRSA